MTNYPFYPLVTVKRRTIVVFRFRGFCLQSQLLTEAELAEYWPPAAWKRRGVLYLVRCRPRVRR